MSVIWKAQWIWANVSNTATNVYAEARKEFYMTDIPRSGKLYISANQEYKVYINGDEIGRGPDPADNDWKYYDTYEIAEFLRAGMNTIAVLAYNFGDTNITTHQNQGPGGLIAQLEIVSLQGTDIISTDQTWKCRRSPRWVEQVSRQHAWYGFREIYLAEQEDGWEHLPYDDSLWPEAVVVCQANQQNSPWPRLLPREIPYLHKEWIKPLSIVRVEANFGRVDGADSLLEQMGKISQSAATHPLMIVDATKPGSMPGVVFDFEREVVGFMELELDAPEGGVVQLFYGESLDLRLYDTFLLKKGLNRISPFDRRAFQFVMPSFQATPQPVRITKCELQFVHYAFPTAGTFECSDPLLNTIWQIGTYTTIVNSQNHIEDCPLRERALWVADCVVMGKVIYHTFGDELLLRKCLLQAARIQNDDGSIPGTGPGKNPFLLPDFCAHWLLGVHTHWTYSKDLGFLAEVWPAIEKLIGWFEAQEDENGLFAKADRAGWWCFVDWASYIDRRDRVTAVSCLYYKALLTASELAEAEGRNDLAVRWRHKSIQLRASIRVHLWNADKQVFADCATDNGLSESITLQTNFAAIWSGVMEEAEAEHFLNHIYEHEDLPEIRGAFFYHIVLETLLARNRADKALSIIRSYWGEMVARGAKTWWETFEPLSPRCTIPSAYQGNTPTYLEDHVPVSLCHGWGASPTYLLTQNLLGVNVLGLGSRRIQLQPNASSVQWAKGEIPTKWGIVKVNWHRNETGSIVFKAEVPKEIQWEISNSNDVIYEINQ